jgi:hypothetical protein
MNTQTYLVAVLSFVLMITNLLGAAFTIARLRSRTTQAAGVGSVDRAPTDASHFPPLPDQKSKAWAAIYFRLASVQLAAAVAIGLGGLVLALAALLEVL